MGIYFQNDLRELRPVHDFFVGVDSDGCVFDSMTVKQCDYFHPLIVRFWGLALIEKQLRETAEFVTGYIIELSLSMSTWGRLGGVGTGSLRCSRPLICWLIERM